MLAGSGLLRAGLKSLLVCGGDRQPRKCVERLLCQLLRDFAGWKGTAQPRSLTGPERGEIRPTLSFGMDTELPAMNACHGKFRDHVSDRSGLPDKTVEQYTRCSAGEYVGQNRILRPRISQSLPMQRRDGSLGACKERGAHLDTGSAQCEGSHNAARISNAPRGNYCDLHRVHDLRDKGDSARLGRKVCGNEHSPVPTCFDTLGNDRIGACLFQALGLLDCRC